MKRLVVLHGEREVGALRNSLRAGSQIFRNVEDNKWSNWPIALDTGIRRRSIRLSTTLLSAFTGVFGWSITLQCQDDIASKTSIKSNLVSHVHMPPAVGFLQPNYGPCKSQQLFLISSLRIVVRR